MKPSTYQGYDSNVRVHLKVAFGPLALQTIREDTVQGYLASALKSGAKPKSVKNHLITLKTMFAAAVKWGYLAFNPAASVKAPKVEREEMDNPKPAEIRILLGANEEGMPHQARLACSDQVCHLHRPAPRGATRPPGGRPGLL